MAVKPDGTLELVHNTRHCSSKFSSSEPDFYMYFNWYSTDISMLTVNEWNRVTLLVSPEVVGLYINGGLNRFKLA